ncbi:hypothetical protein RHIZ404_230651 [Rhizobium sp. EC-SD404]|nr:hypothetical protein RHIZ404_230651 [Rhizobium sp. EC-SD404]
MGRRKWREPQPVYLSELRELRINLDLTCALCVHSGSITVSSLSHLPGHLTMGDLAKLTRCTSCNRFRCASVTPESRPWIAHLRRTGQHNRLPFWACFVPDGDDDQKPDQP